MTDEELKQVEAKIQASDLSEKEKEARIKAWRDLQKSMSPFKVA